MDDSDWCDEHVMSRRLYTLAAVCIGLPLFAGGLLVIAALERVRNWRSNAHTRTEG